MLYPGAHDVMYLPAPKGLADEIMAVATATSEAAPGVENPAELEPLNAPELSFYRRRLTVAAPVLFHFAQAVKVRLLRGAMAVQIDDLGLQDLTLENKRYLLFALANLIGEGTATDPRHRRVLWDVKPRATPRGHFATFSEHDGEAQFHTDTQYYPNPERFFFLYTVQAARCGGGLSYFANAADVIRRMTLTPEGCRRFHTLSTVPVPFRIPSAFARGNQPEFTWAPVIAGVPLIRYREDTLLACEPFFPDVPWGDVKVALGCLNEAAAHASTARAQLPDDSIVFVNNHQALHARTEFRDQNRHLIRVRMHG